MKNRKLAVVLAVIAAWLAAGLGQAALAADPSPLKPQTVCPVMGLPIDPNLYVDVQGKRIYVCCEGCLPEIRRDPEAAVRKLAAAGQAPVPIAAAGEAPAAAPVPAKVRTVGFLLFPDFEILDVTGPLDVWGNLRNLRGPVKIVTVAAAKGAVPSSQGPSLVAEYGFADCPPLDLLVVPGGMGSRSVQKDEAALAWLRHQAAGAEIVMSVCTGASILASAGLLGGHAATTNKMFWKSATEPYPAVRWVKSARWVDDGTIVTSSGVSAGLDMSLHVVERLFDTERAEQLANLAEYEWHRDPAWDPFAKMYGLDVAP